MAKKKKSPDPPNEWMNTYGDMVTLLLCFFVMLYSMSSPDQAKWEVLVKSLNSKSKELTQIVAGKTETAGDSAVDPSIEKPMDEVKDFDNLYYQLVKYVEEQGLAGAMEVKEGDGYTFITFRNTIFFDPDSSQLKARGKTVLDDLSTTLKGISDTINEIQILGHTSQASKDKQVDPVFDRRLSSARADEVLLRIQGNNVVDPKKLTSRGCGQYWPISPFDTPENRAKNRRVEIIITKNDSVVRSLEEYYAEAYNTEIK